MASLRTRTGGRRGGYLMILQRGSAFFRSATPASVTMVPLSTSFCRLASPLRCTKPALLTWVAGSWRNRRFINPFDVSLWWLNRCSQYSDHRCITAKLLAVRETNTKFAGVNQGAHSHVGSLVNSSVSGPGMAV